MGEGKGPTRTWTRQHSSSSPTHTGDLIELPDRYRDLGRIGQGGAGEVRRVHDLVLDRVLAMKLLHPMLVASKTRSRFEAEARVMARLQHPGIVAVHDVGELDDGRAWYTMKEVRGRTFTEVIAELHDRSHDRGMTFRRVLDAFERICQTVAFAHTRNVVHRDIKPSNLMVGEFGDVQVMDWGLARRLDTPETPSLDQPNTAAAWQSAETQDGDVLGTPAYMPPEQARGEMENIGPWSDVYSLGAVLFHLLAGHMPYRGDAYSVVVQVLMGPPPPATGPGVGGPEAEALWDLVGSAMAREPADRPATAGDLAKSIRDWLDGARRDEQALSIVEEATALEPGIRAVRSEAAALRKKARAVLEALRPSDPEELKIPGWSLEDRAADLERRATLDETKWLQTLRSALNVSPDQPQAHARLADHYRAELQAAEEARDPQAIARCEALLRDHDRGEHAAFLSGIGAVTLVTDPPGAQVTLHKYVPYGRRLVTEEVGDLGVTPLREIALEKGSYLLEIRMEGCDLVRYPVHIERGAHWDGIRPGDSEPFPIWLPPEGTLGPDEVYVPAGWFLAGGDPEAAEGLPRQRVWVDAFAIDRFPVTNRQYLEFLNDLVDQGREEEALQAAPKVDESGQGDAEQGHLCDRHHGHFRLRDSDIDPMKRLSPDSPVVHVNWHGARAYVRWRADRDGRWWRLPDELEWEKAARGTDGRSFPWGDHPESTWACVLEAHAGEPGRMDVTTFPIDCSVYEVQGTAGNTRDYCDNLWTADGPPTLAGRLAREPAPEDGDDYRSSRGGAWASVIRHSRVVARFASRPGIGFSNVGCRCARGVDRD